MIFNMNTKKFVKSALVLIPFLTITFLPKRVDAANLNINQFRGWCLSTKGGTYSNEGGGSKGIVAKCKFKDKNGKEKEVTITFNGKTLINPNYCLCDSNGNGKDDIGDEIKDRHGNQIAQNISLFNDLSNPSVAIDSSILASLNEASQNLFTETEFNNWVALTLNSSGNLEIAVDLRDVPTLDENSIFANTGFTEMNLVYLDEMGSLSGITLASLTQGEKNFLEFDPTIFDPFGDFSAWQLGVTIYNPTTMEQVLAFEDKTIPEPSSILSLLTLGILGAASTLKRKAKISKEKELEKISEV